VVVDSIVRPAQLGSGQSRAWSWSWAWSRPIGRTRRGARGCRLHRAAVVVEGVGQYVEGGPVVRSSTPSCGRGCRLHRAGRGRRLHRAVRSGSAPASRGCGRGGRWLRRAAVVVVPRPSSGSRAWSRAWSRACQVLALARLRRGRAVVLVVGRLRLVEVVRSYWSTAAAPLSVEGVVVR
jgi:hypothetical protein